MSSLWGMRAAAAAVLLFVFDMGATGVWYGIALSNVTAAVVGGAFFLRGGWVQNVVDETPDDPDPDGAEEDAVTVG